MRRLLVWFLCLAAFTSLHWFARRLNRPSSASFSVNRLTHDAQCKIICEECALAAEYKQVYEGFPLELPALPRFASDLNSSRLSQALHVIVITDDCTIFNGRSLRGPPAVWKYLSQAVKVTSELCVGTVGASQPNSGACCVSVH